MIFWRIINNQLFAVHEVDKLGFNINEGYYIPDEYLEQKNFIILRTCFGIGDWGIISAMPKKLKEKYPDCKISIPSEKFLSDLFSQYQSNWSSWDRPFRSCETIFKNNPYIDSIFDSFHGEIFHDHYRVYTSNSEEPLIKQMLRFWQFKEEEMTDINPQIYWDEKEIDFANNIIKSHTGNGEFGTLLLSNKFDGENLEKIQDIINKFNLPLYYWISNPNLQINFKKALDLRHIDIRVQMYIKSKATFNVGNQSGVNDTISSYAPTYTVPRKELGSNYLPNQIYI